MSTTSTASPEKAAAPKRTRPSRRELIQQNANPTTRLVGSMKSFSVRVDFSSDLMHSYMETNQLHMFNAYERIAGLKRMLSRDPALSRDVDAWIEANTEILRVQIEQLKSQTAQLAADSLLDDLDITTPESYSTTFQASHPIIHKMISLIQYVDDALNTCEAIYMQGLMDDTQLNTLRMNAIGAIRASVDRIYKVTTPGTRSGGKYKARELAEWLRSGNKLTFTDTPLIAAHVVANYEVVA